MSGSREGSAEAWGYRLRKMEIVWELAQKVIPERRAATGQWSGESYYLKVQETLQKLQEIVDVVFSADKEAGP